MNEKLKEFYKNNPNKFVEDFLGVKLNKYQKVMLRMNLFKKRRVDK